MTAWLITIIGVVFLTEGISCVSQPTQGCEVDGKIYGAGESWAEGCSLNCSCSEFQGVYGIGCVSMCPLFAVPFPCQVVENPDKDEATSTNCCPTVFCPDILTECDIMGESVPVGQIRNFGCSMRCGCHQGPDGMPTFWCLPKCGLRVIREGCHLVENPDKDEVTSSNCCPVEVCD